MRGASGNEDAGAFARTALAAEAAQRAMAEATEEARLLERVCRAFAEVGRHAVAWIGFCAPDEDRRLQPAAWAGVADDGAPAIAAIGAELGWCQGHAASGTGEPWIVQGIARSKDPALAGLRDHARQHGYDSACALPLC